MRLRDLLLMVALGTGAFFIVSTHAANLSAGDLLKAASGSAVYYFGDDGKRHAFPTEKIFHSWYYDFSEVKTISDTEIASIPIGSNATYRPGVRLVKVTTDPRVYAVEGRTLRWVTSEAMAEVLFGKTWSEQVDDISDALFTDYAIGEVIEDAGDYSPTFVRNSYASVQAIITTPPPTPSTAPPSSTSSTDPTLPTSPTSTIPSEPSDSIAPTVPEDILANALTDQSAFVTWASSADNVGVSGYAIYRDGTLVGETSINRFTDTGLSPGATYAYAILAVDSSGNKSPLSNSKSVTMPVPGRSHGGSQPSYVIANWPLDEGSGSSTANIESSLYQGALNSTTTWTSGISGNALFFGDEMSYVSVGSIAELRGIQQFTLSAWMKRASTSSNMFIGDRDGVQDWNGFDDEGIGMAMSGGATGRFRFHVEGAGATAYGFIDVPGIDWHHYTMVFDGTKSGNSQRLKLYLDGVAQSVGFSGTIPSVTRTKIVNFYLGSFNTHGTIDEVQLYSRVLTDVEVASHAGL